MNTPRPPAAGEAQLRWELSGAGMEHLALASRPVPQPAEHELLVRIEACGICFSDIKILNQGGSHARLQGRDLARDPVVMGHETAMTVIQVGGALAGRFHTGERYLIQADVYYQGGGMAFGYRLPGGFSQYQVIGREILDGDEGCYLLPVSGRLSHAQAALCEPWACVEAAYAFSPRRAPRPGGRALVVTAGGAPVPAAIESAAARAGGEVLHVRDGELPDGEFDDILLSGGARVQAAVSLLASGGVLALAGRPADGAVSVDIGSVHYRGHWYTGAREGDPYAWPRTAELTAGGSAWFIGAGGPLGQMHLQRALSLPHPPVRIFVSQNGGPRLDDLRQRFSAPAAARGVELVLLDPRELGDAIYRRVLDATGGRGCDDICVIIPSAEVVERAFEMLAPGGGMDVFAGVLVGTTARLDLGRMAADGVRLWGTSGSSIADLRSILDKAEAGALATDRVVAAVGGIGAVKEGLAAVREGIFLGKTVIYPHCGDLPLLPLSALAERHPSVGERLADGRYWTPAAEAELLRLYAG